MDRKTYPHANESLQLRDRIVHILRNDGISILLQLLLAQLRAQPIRGLRACKNFELSHEHNHGIDKRGITFYRVDCPLPDLVQEVVERNAKH